ncbi:MAG: hypothetical protein JXA74_05240, partial [Anaerolineae bacterium]|nr:hypothetical protein [Anaerolineae bacterium]
MPNPDKQAAPVFPLHPWLRQVRVAFVADTLTPLLAATLEGLTEAFGRLGHTVQPQPDTDTDILVATAAFGQVLDWRQALLFAARRRFGLDRAPLIFTLVGISPQQLAQNLSYFEQALKKEPPDPAEFAFPGMAPEAWRVLVEQGQRGGAILSLLRLIQSQAKCIRIILVVGDDAPLEAYHFDLVGAYPRSDGLQGRAFYDDLVLRTVTAVSTDEITDHQVIDRTISAATWQTLASPEQMRLAGKQLGRRGFFTNMIRIADLVHVPAVGDSVARQYSEGCYATWEPQLRALVATVTGSARPVDKGNLSDDDLAVIVGVRPDGRGALVQHVERKANLPPSSESVELRDMDSLLPEIRLGPEWGLADPVPVVRSKLHGHRGVAGYDPARVEYVPLDAPYYHYIVSCATEAQAVGIKHAFARS